MSRRLSVQLKNQSGQTSSKPKVKFPDDLVFLDSVKDNDVEEVRLMLRRASANIDINKMNSSGLRPLHQACLEGSYEVVKLLVENGADVNSVDEDSWTPLHAAVSMGHCAIAEYLIGNGADLMALTSENERPIDLADQTDFPTISLLLNNMKASGEDDYEEEDYDIEDVDSKTVAHKIDESIKYDNNNSNKESKTNGKKKKSRFSIV